MFQNSIDFFGECSLVEIRLEEAGCNIGVFVKRQGKKEGERGGGKKRTPNLQTSTAKALQQPSIAQCVKQKGKEEKLRTKGRRKEEE